MMDDEAHEQNTGDISKETCLKVDEILAEFLSKNITVDENSHRKSKKRKHEKHKHKKSKSHKSHKKKKHKHKSDEKAKSKKSSHRERKSYDEASSDGSSSNNECAAITTPDDLETNTKVDLKAEETVNVNAVDCVQTNEESPVDRRAEAVNDNVLLKDDKCTLDAANSGDAVNKHYSDGEIESVSQDESDKESDCKAKKRKHSSYHHRKSHHKKSSRNNRSKHGSRSRSITKESNDSSSYKHSKRQDKYEHRKRTRSRSPTHHKQSHQSYKYSRKRSTKSRSRSRSPSSKRSSHSKSCKFEKIDKTKLLEIARKNALAMMQTGELPSGMTTDKFNKDQLVAIASGGQSIEQLTDFCKSLARKIDEASSSSSSVDDDDKSGRSDDDSCFVNRSFKAAEGKRNIVMKIRNAVQVPIKTPAEKATEQAKLRIQFPVSSGNQHRVKESEWVPVEPKKSDTASSSGTTVTTTPSEPSKQSRKPEQLKLVEDSKSSQQTQNALDLGTIVSERLSAVRKLQDNPNDVLALNMMYRAQQKMQSWVQSKQLPGQFTGNTGVQVLSPEQLAGSGTQAWVRKDQFHRAQKVQGGMGMYLMQKMGWQPGTGLGKNNEGSTEPLLLDIKTDKKGLVCHGESAKRYAGQPQQVTRDLSDKHPVSALMELCSKRRWGPPQFNLIFDDGPDHKKNFLFKVKINGIEYQPSVASTNKKQAKAQAATICLQQMGLIPK